MSKSFCLFVLFLAYFTTATAAADCKSQLDNRANLVPAHLFSTAKHPLYRISPIIPGLDHTLNGSTLMLATEDKKCPKDCIYDLEGHKSKEGSVLHVRGNPFPKFVPFGYTEMSSEKKLACARQMGFCGAEVPIYRFYRIVPNAILHAYSFKASELSGYVREPVPICYGWKSTVPVVKGEDYMVDTIDVWRQITVDMSLGNFRRRLLATPRKRPYNFLSLEFSNNAKMRELVSPPLFVPENSLVHRFWPDSNDPINYDPDGWSFISCLAVWPTSF